ncbi:hypothetical protein HMPREF1567_1129 [Providencia alcalifaciens PAL-2]|jgi:hypothetical protein|nr:hypothetical protein HMPREF1562_1143 [Providencia alcalifaciens F90-2004]EUC94535.1 hypothetical protein HMPREF1567_1129 [Providencia alcalifaciens PAL-2]
MVTEKIHIEWDGYSIKKGDKKFFCLDPLKINARKITELFAK